MRFLLASLAFLFVSVTAQDLANLPQCAYTAAQSGIASSGCGSTDIWCICKATAFLDGLQTLIQEACTADERKATISFAVNLCNSVGVTLYPNADTSGSLVVSSGVTVTAASETASPSESSFDQIITESGTLSAGFDSSSTSYLSTITTQSAISTPYSSKSPSATPHPTLPTPSKNTTNSTNVHTNTPSPFAGAASRTDVTWLATSLTLLGAAAVAWGL